LESEGLRRIADATPELQGLGQVAGLNSFSPFEIGD
jgi:hypothetical protein